jgi:protein-disulfide isomerase
MRIRFSLAALAASLIASTACFAGHPPIANFPGAPEPGTHPWLKEQLEKDRYPCQLQDSPFIGPEDAPVTINEFIDYQCPYCSDEEKALKRIVREYPTQVKLVVKNLPLSKIHDGAMSRAKVAQAMANQGKFWEAHDALLHGENSNQVMKGANQEKLKAYWASGGDGQVDKDLAMAKHLGLASTPSFDINGIRIGGALSYNQLKLLIDYELARKAAQNQKTE